MNQKILGSIVVIAVVAVGGYFLVNKKPDILITKGEYSTIELKDVKNYVQKSTTDLVVTSGIVVGIKLTPYYNLVLSDSQGTYVLVNFGRAFTDRFAPIFSSLKIGDAVQLKGMPTKTEGSLVVLDGNISIETTGVESASTFGMISLNEIQKIDLKNVEANSNWQTYTDTQYGFEVKAPKDWINPDRLKGFSVSEVPIPTENSVSVKNLKKEIINGVEFTSYISIEECDMYSYVTVHNSLSYRFSTCEQDQAPILKQILSTLKFTDKTTSKIDTSKWRTYTNTKYGFEFRYPSVYSIDESRSKIASKWTPSIILTTKSTLSVEEGSMGESSDTLDIFPRATTDFLKNYFLLPEPIIFSEDYFSSKSQEWNEYFGKVVIDKSVGFQLDYNSGESITFYTIFDNKDGTYFIVSTNEAYDESYDQILSTFKFIEPKTSANGIFVNPDGKKTLSIGSEVNLQWNIPKKSTDERYSLGIYLLNEKGEKVSNTSIIAWNYAKNGETSSNWKVGYLPSYVDGSGGEKIAVPGKYKLLLEYVWYNRNDDNRYSIMSNVFEIK
jgi:hypothetical protein